MLAMSSSFVTKGQKVVRHARDVVPNVRTSNLKVWAKLVALFTDGRFLRWLFWFGDWSRLTRKLREGGALVEEGDRIEIDIPNRSIRPPRYRR